MPSTFALYTTFPAGTLAVCNRCDAVSPLPKPCEGSLESRIAIGPVAAVYRLHTMCVLPNCGHMDAHWVFVHKED